MGLAVLTHPGHGPPGSAKSGSAPPSAKHELACVTPERRVAEQLPLAKSQLEALRAAGFAVAQVVPHTGVRFCMADGGGADDAMTARNLPYNAASGIGLGLTREEALKSITLYPAQILGVADRLGSIEAGKTADLVIADGDPLEVTTRIEQVYINGKPTSMENRQSRLFEKYDAKPRGAKARKR